MALSAFFFLPGCTILKLCKHHLCPPLCFLPDLFPHLRGTKSLATAHLADLFHPLFPLSALWSSGSRPPCRPPRLHISTYPRTGQAAVFADSDRLLLNLGCLPVAMIPSPFPQPSSLLRVGFGFSLSLFFTVTLICLQPSFCCVK